MARRGRCGGAIVPVEALVVALAGSTSAAASFTRLGNLSAPGEDAIDPQLASAADGDAIAVWERSDGTNFRLQARRLPAGGTPGPTKTLSAPGQDAFTPEVASDADGNAIVVWDQLDGANARVNARQLSAGGTLGPTENLSSSGHDAFATQVASAANGATVVAWQRPDGANSRVQGAAGP